MRRAEGTDLRRGQDIDLIGGQGADLGGSQSAVTAFAFRAAIWSVGQRRDVVGATEPRLAPSPGRRSATWSRLTTCSEVRAVIWLAFSAATWPVVRAAAWSVVSAATLSVLSPNRAIELIAAISEVDSVARSVRSQCRDLQSNSRRQPAPRSAPQPAWLTRHRPAK